MVRALPLLRLSSLAWLLTLAGAASCASSESSERSPPQAAPATKRAPATVVPPDPHSRGQPGEARVRHVSLALDVDFAAKVLSGTATLDLEKAPGAKRVVLDTRDLIVEEVSAGSGAALTHLLEVPGDPLLGQALTVELPHDVTRVTVRYRTRPSAPALQWLDAGGTASGRHPFLFTQGQAILTRTWVPLQDSPGVRITYDASVEVPAELSAVMSAEQLTPQGEPASEGRKRFRFRMEQPIPPYLMALAVGELAFAPLGPRTGVYAEPDVVAKAAEEFADVEEMMTSVEELYGPYRWGRYDILVLPPSFPFGGMENPRLTFLSPTVIAGDRSLVAVVAHELAHSWSGNLVTNATWADFWLNEGFTSYLENRILEVIYGVERAKLTESLGRRDLLEEMEELGHDHAGTRLHQDLVGKDPDDSITSTPYDKGMAFLRHLENQLGREAFDGFLRRYFDENAFQTMTSERFLVRLREEMVKGDAALEARLELDTWMYATGLPKTLPPVDSALLTHLEAAATRFAAQGDLDEATAAPAGQSRSSLEWVIFLRALPRTLDAAKIAALDEKLGASKTGNSEIRFEWLKLVVENRYEPGFTSLSDFLTRQGRRRLVRPLYEGLVEKEWGKALARDIYERARARYHPLTVETLDHIFDKAGA